MKFVPHALPLIALTAALALSGCNKAPETTDNAMVNVDDAAEVNGTAFNDEAPAVENAADSDTAAVTVAAVPKPAAGVPAAQAAPLASASEIEDEIRAGTGIQRIRYGDGWAWTRQGKIVRTADRSGQDVAYFRGGEASPFFVQRGDKAFAYQGDRPVRQFDRDGHATTPDADRAREAEQAARDARDQHDRAGHARDDARRGPIEPPPSPTPTPSPSRSGRDHRGHDQPDAQPTPSPTDTPTSRWRQPQRTPERTPDR